MGSAGREGRHGMGNPRSTPQRSSNRFPEGMTHKNWVYLMSLYKGDPLDPTQGKCSEK